MQDRFLTQMSFGIGQSIITLPKKGQGWMKTWVWTVPLEKTLKMPILWKYTIKIKHTFLV